MNSIKAKIISTTQTDLAKIEAALKNNLNPYYELTAEIAGHILFAGGKRLRPLLMILSARICGNEKKDYTSIAVMFEYLHAATLLHDDLVDDAVMRRGKSVAHSIWGNSAAVLTGDFLLARSLSLAAKTKIPAIVEVIAKITEYMSQGEIIQLMNKQRLDLSEKEYLEVIKYKTAVVFQGACRIGALITGASRKQEDSLAEYGMNLGIAFQMADDLLDYTSDAKLLGKNPGADIREGKLTLPVIYALFKADTKDRQFMEKIISAENFNFSDFTKFQQLLEKYQSISYTQKIAVDYVKKAKTALDSFQVSKTRDILLDLADYTMDRKA